MSFLRPCVPSFGLPFQHFHRDLNSLISVPSSFSSIMKNLPPNPQISFVASSPPHFALHKQASRLPNRRLRENLPLQDRRVAPSAYFPSGWHSRPSLRDQQTYSCRCIRSFPHESGWGSSSRIPARESFATSQQEACQSSLRSAASNLWQTPARHALCSFYANVLSFFFSKHSPYDAAPNADEHNFNVCQYRNSGNISEPSRFSHLFQRLSYGNSSSKFSLFQCSHVWIPFFPPNASCCWPTNASPPNVHKHAPISRSSLLST